jgi:PhnB protein
VTSIQPQLWMARPSAAIAFYEAAFGATVELRVGDGEDLVAQLAVGEARFWVTAASEAMRRRTPEQADGTTGRILLVVDDPDAVHAAALAAGATSVSPVADEHGWRVGRILDPEGHEWELGTPSGS